MTQEIVYWDLASLGHGFIGMKETPDGVYVRRTDHAAEIARLRAEADANQVDAERWRHARKLLRADEIQAGADSFAFSGGLFDEAVNVETDKAIDEAMGADA